MTRSAFVYQSMRMLCATPDFGAQLFELLTPLDLSALLYAFNIPTTKKQSRRYMQFWRQIFTDKGWMLWILSHGFKVSFVGNDLITMMNWVRNPGLMNAGRRKLYLDLNLVSCVASWKYALLSDKNFEYVVKEKNKHFNEFARNDNFNQALQSGIDARYSELIMGKDLSEDRTMPFAWLDLTVISTIKHEEFNESYYEWTNVDSSMSVGLWYGEKSMQKWRFPRRSGSSADMDAGVVLKMDNASSMNMPMNISLPKFWCITKVVSKNSFTGA
ncbi:hypothetical protein BU25DRAFT_406292 [Macroventuria anomochaeta]|uniref:Uncharacterized protein n=1 Tax=Macroventuria anomochaeta TaxID=301207 RepID=A0ACB6SIA8_9PLEO|nr:uncharacterized protein BU25DRAFT_406292 [Macroventuria anomochaeta]KAF2633024.1 hypothetical protein BU25DRAFT_406292 [Macroventuria anomochaeta]